jgi:hypothetical protein
LVAAIVDSERERLPTVTTFVMAHDRLREMVRLGALHPDNWGSDLFYAAWTWTLIHLHDALKAAESLGERCTITADVTPEGIDLTELIRRARNSACHIGSHTRWREDAHGYSRLAWTFIPGGRLGDTRVSGELFEQCEFEDDNLLLVGAVRLYMKRNLDVGLNWVFDFAPRNSHLRGWGF